MDFIINPVVAIEELLRNLLTQWGLTPELTQIILYVLGAAILAIAPLVVTIFLIWAERKLLGRVQDRLGPNRLGPFGIFQRFADMAKIFTKEFITPIGADIVPYNMAPIMVVMAVLSLWAVIPLGVTVYGVDINVGVLYIVAIGSIGTLGIILAGWGSNNKYALLGAYRAVAQMLSYEVPTVVSLLIPVMLSGSMSMVDIVESQDVWYIFMAPVPAFIFFVSSIAEVGRSPFDVLEADSELVAGYNIEYSGLKFGFFFVGDFLHAFTTGLLFTTFFLGGWRLGPWTEQIPILGVAVFVAKSTVVWFITLLIRGSMPRFRIDQIMSLNWKYFVPLSLAAVALTAILDKTVLMNVSSIYIKAAVLLVANIVLFVIADRLMSFVLSKRPRPVVISKPLPEARPGKDAA